MISTAPVLNSACGVPRGTMTGIPLASTLYARHPPFMCMKTVTSMFSALRNRRYDFSLAGCECTGVIDLPSRNSSVL